LHFLKQLSFLILYAFRYRFVDALLELLEVLIYLICESSNSLFLIVQEVYIMQNLDALSVRQRRILVVTLRYVCRPTNCSLVRCI